jgi:uncharacterized membrane protein YhaH (DUF805 family)
MTFSQSVKTCLSKYGSITGRASRSEYWWFVLFSFLLQMFGAFVGILIAGPTGGEGVRAIVSLALLIPSITVAARRMHDINKSGWNQLWPLTIIGIPFYIYWLCKDGDKEANRFGEPVTQAEA